MNGSMFLNIQPDWSKIWTAAEAEAELPEFKFDGPGWYRDGKTDSILVIPTGPVTYPMPDDVDGKKLYVWRGKKQWPLTQTFQFNVYSRRDMATVFNAIVNAPCRGDSW